MTNAGEEPYGELVARALKYAGPVRMGNGCSADLVFELATAIETLVRKVATEHALFVIEARKHSEWLERAIDAERVQRLMASDWLQFCESMDVRFDTQEAVAYALHAHINAVERERDELLADLRTARRALRGEP